MQRWLGWLVIAMLASTARAEPGASAQAATPASPAPRPGSHPADPLPAEEVAPAAEAKHKTVATAPPPAEPAALDPKNLQTLTDDPVVGKADRIDGDETKGFVAFTFDDGPNPETTPQVI